MEIKYLKRVHGAAHVSLGFLILAASISVASLSQSQATTLRHDAWELELNANAGGFRRLACKGAELCALVQGFIAVTGCIEYQRTLVR